MLGIQHHVTLTADRRRIAESGRYFFDRDAKMAFRLRGVVETLDTTNVQAQS